MPSPKVVIPDTVVDMKAMSGGSHSGTASTGVSPAPLDDDMERDNNSDVQQGVASPTAAIPRCVNYTTHATFHVYHTVQSPRLDCYLLARGPAAEALLAL